MTDAAGDDLDGPPVDDLVEQFLRRHRAGEPVTVESFAAAHPAAAATLRELLPTLLALERVKRDRQSSGSSGRRVALPALSRLGDFAIVRELGRGGMGVVFEAVQESLGRRVALKVLPQAALLTGSQLERFRREAQIAAQLHHSNIVPVYGSGESDGYHWYAMQFIAGQSLDQWRAQQAAARPVGSGAWSVRGRFVARIGAAAASALHHAHGQGTLHRDVKPANLLLEDTGHLWVTDFGLAKALESEGLTHSGDLLGTLQYMAPEQFAGTYDVRSEVYALGVTLYELLVLQPAFAGRTRSELMEAIRARRPEPLRRVCPELPEDLVVVVERAMAKDPGDRYADAGALAADLQAFLDDRPIAARRQSAFALVRRWCRHNRALASLAASTVLAVVGAGVTGWVAYVTTADALRRAHASATGEAAASQRAEKNLQLSLAAFADVFDVLVGRDPLLALEEDPDTGEQTVVARTVVTPGDAALLQRMLAFYDQFAHENGPNASLRVETARAWRRVGAIQVRLGDLDAAEAAYQESLTRYRDVTDRPVVREIAALHVEFGRLLLRRERPRDAAQRFRLALQLLDGDPAGGSRTGRRERVEAHWLLARTAEMRGNGGPGGPVGAGGGPGGRPGDERGRDPERHRAEARQELAAAQELLAGLLQEEPADPELRAMEARCLLLSTRLRRGDAPAAGADDEREADRRRGLAILRELVAADPAADEYRFELCEALLGDRRRGGGPRGRDEADAARLAVLREVRDHAVVLRTQLPAVGEYRLLRARVGSMLGAGCGRAALEADDAARAALQQEAEAELRAALELEGALLAAGPQSMRLLLQSAGTRVALGLLLAERGDTAAAREVATGMVAFLRSQMDAVGERPRPLPIEPRLFDLAEMLLQRTGATDAVRDLRELRTQFEQRAARPGEPRRGR
jgi:tetratricopeptide (TPR) repeat protein